MDKAAREAEFTEYVAARAERLRKTAYLVCGDWHRAQDLTQIALAKAYVAWPRIRRADAVDAYVKQIILREYLGQQRRRSWHERPTDELGDLGRGPASGTGGGSGTGPGSDQADLRLPLLDALGRLTPKRRAVVVLRYWEDHSVETVADLLHMSTSAVKAASLRALADLRVLLGEDLRVDAF